MDRIMLVLLVLLFAACGLDRSSKESDSLLTDTAVMDTADMKAAPVDTTALRIDSVSHDARVVP